MRRRTGGYDPTSVAHEMKEVEHTVGIGFTLNGENVSVTCDPDTPVLYALRDDLGLSGVRYGCGTGECGACTALIDGDPVNTCDTPVAAIAGSHVETVEGHSRDPVIGALVAAFLEEQAAQCAYCSPGIIMTAAATLRQTPRADADTIRRALADRLCRCGAHGRILAAIERVAGGWTATPITIDGPTPTDGPPPSEARGNEFVKVVPDGTVVLSTGKVELGQGVTTALAQIAAEALGVRPGRVRLQPTDTATSPDQGVTSASMSIAVGGADIRAAAEALRADLLGICATSLGADPELLTVADGTVRSPDGATTSYWEALGGRDEIPDRTGAGGTPDASASVRRWDLPGKLSGQPSFVHDIRLPGMVHGRVVRSPENSMTLTSVDPDRASAMPGVISVVTDGRFLGVLAEREYQAIRAATALTNDATWSALPSHPDPGHVDALPSESHRIVDSTRRSSPDTGDAVSGRFTRPFIAHASIGPSCAVAVLDGDELTVWTHSQGVFLLRRDIALALGMPTESVRIIHAAGSGCYGHNGADDVALDAALLARHVPGRPVRVQWMREDEFLREPYGPAMAVQIRARVEDGHIAAWETDVWSQTHSARPGRGVTPALLAASEIDPPFERCPTPMVSYPPGGATRNSRPLYDVGDFGLTAHFVAESAVRTSALRSLGAHMNVFAIESTIDTLAKRAGTDPVEFRIRHLADPRAVAVLRKVAEMPSGPIGGLTPDGHGLGLGFARYKNSGCYVAVVAEVVADDHVSVPRLWAVVDAGRLVNPDGAANQIEGGCIQAASWTLKEKMPLANGRAEAKTWTDYPILRFDETPEVTVVFIDAGDEPSLGVGEGAQGPTTAAIANGLHAVLGVPIRDLPFTRDTVERALLA